MKVITLPAIDEPTLAAVESVLRGSGIDYRIADEDPTRNTIGGFRKSDPSTSRDAAVGVFPRTGNQRHRVLMAVVRSGWSGATASEIEARTGIVDRGRRAAELKAGGWIKPAGFTREGSMGAQQEALIATEKTLDWLKEQDQ